jgi:hypothetical protein
MEIGDKMDLKQVINKPNKAFITDDERKLVF